MMSCREEIQSWSFPTLVGAFVELAVAYLLLLAAATTFLASRMLSLFGLRLPCTCSHSAAGGWCLRSLLSQGPHGRIDSVHSSIASRPPFHGCIRTHADRLKIEFCEGGTRAFGSGVAESCGSVKRDLLLIRGDGDASSSGFEEGGGWMGSRVLKKGVMRRRRRRRRVAEVERRRSLDYCKTPLLGWQEGGGGGLSPRSDCVSSRRGLSEGSCSPVRFGGDPSLVGDGYFSGANTLQLIEQNTSEDAFSGVDGKRNFIKKEMKDPCRSPEEIIRILEKALEEEHSARAALRRELEKERNASATAADEAMAMIERLQNEKALIDMNAKQYQRMIEEKAAYDEEEMELLKEIIVRRERELFVMGKEVEMYKLLTVPGGMEILDTVDGHPDTVQFSGQVASTSEEYKHDLSMTLPHVPQTSKMKQKEKSDYGATFNEFVFDQNGSTPCVRGKNLLSLCLPDGAIAHGIQPLGNHIKQSNSPEINICADDDSSDFQEKGIVSVDVYISPVPSQNPGVVDSKSSCAIDSNRDPAFQPVTALASESRENFRTIENGLQHVTDFMNSGIEKNSRGIDSYISCIETEPSAYDVHVIDDKSSKNEGENAKDDVPCIGGVSVISEDHLLSLEPDEIRNIEILSDRSRRNWIIEEPGIERSYSEVSRAAPLSGMISPLDLRRSSMSAVDVERCKLETEVENLRRRLKIVQQGREKLNLSVEHTEKEYFHLQILDEIASQIREIKRLTDSDKTIRPASLPPPSSKVCMQK